jgi:hypothetical protein
VTTNSGTDKGGERAREKKGPPEADTSPQLVLQGELTRPACHPRCFLSAQAGAGLCGDALYDETKKPAVSATPGLLGFSLCVRDVAVVSI